MHILLLCLHTVHILLCFGTPLSIDVEVHSSFCEFTTRNPQSHNQSVFESIQVGKPGEHKRIRCIVGVWKPDTVKRFCYRGHQPAICTTDGAIARPDMISNHLDNQIHLECVKADRVKNLSAISKIQSVPLLRMISNQDKELADKTGHFITLGNKDFATEENYSAID